MSNRLAFRTSLLLVIPAIWLYSSFPVLRAQSVASAAPSIEPGAPPPDVSPEWKQLVGIYGKGKSAVVVLERDQKLHWQVSRQEEWDLQDLGDGTLMLSRDSMAARKVTVVRDQLGQVTQLQFDHTVYPRADAGSDPAHFFHVTPIRSLTEISAAALAAKPPSEPGPFRPTDLVELVTLDPGFHLDIHYAQSNNFLSTPLYSQARAFLQRPAAEALRRALDKLKPLGYGLLIHDAYRPWYVTKIFWDATPAIDHDFVADPQKGSKHNRGCAVDITLYHLASGKPIEMPGLYDEMSPRSFPTFAGGTSLERWHRDLLRQAIESEGFTVDGNEWWHFDYQDWKQYPILNISFEKLGQP